jgi:hypothetical protein
MRNRTFSFSGLESAWIRNYKSDDWKRLTNKFTGRRLFSYNYFNLLIGNMSVLENNNNRWLLENILDYSESEKNIYFIPVLKKIAADPSADSRIRQRSAEILESSWIGKNTFNEPRTPQTSEILKLLKVNSVESKRNAICLIGKFRFTEMLHEVADCLGIPGLETDSASVLGAFRSEAGKELVRLYLKSSGNIRTSKAILRILGKTGIPENIAFVYERLWSTSKEIKEAALHCLIDNNFNVPAEERERMMILILEVAKNLLWIISAQITLEEPGNESLRKPLSREINLWKRFLSGLLFITYESGRVESYRKMTSGDESDSSILLSELLDLIFNEPKKTVFWLLTGSMSDEQKLKRFHQHFPGEMPDSGNLIEDLLNHDYNQISLWTKACTLRNVSVIRDEYLFESVIALLFSPEEILQEEAAKLLARSGIERYQSVSQRIPISTKVRLDRITDSRTQKMDLLFEKTDFLSYLFPEIQEDKLLFLAKEMKFLHDHQEEYVPDQGGAVLWVYSKGGTSPDLVKIFFNDSREFIRRNISDEGTGIYVLSLRTIEEFLYRFPEHSFEVLKYIDDHEEQS